MNELITKKHSFSLLFSAAIHLGLTYEDEGANFMYTTNQFLIDFIHNKHHYHDCCSDGNTKMKNHINIVKIPCTICKTYSHLNYNAISLDYASLRSLTSHQSIDYFTQFKTIILSTNNDINAFNTNNNNNDLHLQFYHNIISNQEQLTVISTKVDNHLEFKNKNNHQLMLILRRIILKTILFYNINLFHDKKLISIDELYPLIFSTYFLHQERIESTYLQQLKHQITNQILLTKQQNKNIFITGLFGCGIYANNILDVSKVYGQVLSEHGHHLNEIILCNKMIQSCDNHEYNTMLTFAKNMVLFANTNNDNTGFHHDAPQK
jgi:hypothetical protein